MIQGSYRQGLTCKILRLLKDNADNFKGLSSFRTASANNFLKSGISFMELP